MVTVHLELNHAVCEVGHNNTLIVRFLYCTIREFVTKCQVDSTGMITLNSFSSALLKAESLPSSLECFTVGWIFSRYVL